jgi:hypothetical protein
MSHNPSPIQIAMNDIQSKVLIVRPSISMPGNSRTDEALTDEVHVNHHMDDKAGRYVKQLYPSNSLKPLTKIAGEARRYHKQNTVTCSFGDLLPTVRFENYKQVIDGYTRQFHAEADRFQANFDSIMAEARRIHQGTFKPEFYPTRETVREEFKFSLFTAPLPRSNDLVVQYMAEDRLAELRASLDQEVQRAGRDAGRQVMARVLARVQKICDTLANPDAIFRDSLIENLRDMVQLAPALNIADDPSISAVVRECADKLLKAPETLRQVPAVRALTAEHAKNIALRFGQMGARRLAA